MIALSIGVEVGLFSQHSIAWFRFRFSALLWFVYRSVEEVDFVYTHLIA